MKYKFISIEKISNPEAPDEKLYNMGCRYMDKHMAKQAFVNFNAAITLNPYNWAALNNRGILFFILNQHDAAIKDFTDALKVIEDATFYYNRGTVLYVQEQDGLAFADFLKAFTLMEEL